MLGYDSGAEAAEAGAGPGSGGGGPVPHVAGGGQRDEDVDDVAALVADGEDDGDMRPWRCLDGSHEAGCRRCTPPPSGAGCVLRGGRPRAQSGEKQLRGALCRTAEWRCADARAAAADALDAAGAANAAQAVRKRDCSALRKGDMLRLCRLWRYASHVWQPSGWPAEREPRVPGAAPPRAKRPVRMPKAVTYAAQLQMQMQMQAGAAQQAAMHASPGGVYFSQPTQARCSFACTCAQAAATIDGQHRCRPASIGAQGCSDAVTASHSAGSSKQLFC